MLRIGRLTWPPVLFAANASIMKAIGAMPTAGLTAVSALKQIMLGEDIKTVFDVIVDAFDERLAGSRFDGFLLLRRHWKQTPRPAVQD